MSATKPNGASFGNGSYTGPSASGPSAMVEAEVRKWKLLEEAGDASVRGDTVPELRTSKTLAEQKDARVQNNPMFSIHGEQAARRRAISELIFFAGTNDLRRCKQIVSVWNIKVSDPNVMDYDKRTPLHVAAAEGAYSVVEWLVKSEACPVNPLDRHMKTPLEEAARNDHTEVVRMLSDQGGCVWEEEKLVPLEKSRIRGIVNTRRMAMSELGWEPEWEVSPKELKLIEKIGSGEFGDVFKAKWHGSYVAAKILKRSDEIALGDFRTEIAILRKIHHPNTTQFLGACTKQKPYVVITELMACSLSDAFSKTFYAPTVRRQVEAALDFARGMAYLHSRRQPIVHRDLKPANLMISGNLNADAEQLYQDSGIIKVADFGLSKSLVPVDKHGKTQDLSMTATYTMTGETGSYRYMAPEVFRHEPYSLKVDVYSFAMIVFQLFECVPPFAGMDPVEAARGAAMLGNRPGFPPRNKISPVELKLRELVTKCWDGDADKRPSFEEIVAELEQMLEGLPKHGVFRKGQTPDNTGCCVVA